ncbi:fimbria/pilus outer membrane usher protein [Otariodibacter oris]|uniref:Outer membrane usher protein n=1 Tax=Otariodibacter oris TaxID=1032623 RepID=A0A420XG67_9PAST|nr:fimbria/pilus outer membrane usher protein [Otariodibacter oris]RKR71756.1 outer membrane usher protein [Otariodibacter oris]
MYFKYSLLFLSLIYSVSSFSEEFEFDENFGSFVSGQDVDFSRFKFGNPIPSGEYIADLEINGQNRGTLSIKFEDKGVDVEPIYGLCLTSNLKNALDLKDNAFIYNNSEQECISAVEAIPSADIQFDISTQVLKITIPQEFIVSRPRGYISPSLLNDGVPTAFVRYDVTYNKYDSTSYKTLGLNAGLNLFNWSIRHRGNKYWADQQQGKYKSSYLYAQHEVLPLQAQFTMGDFYVNGNFIDGFGIRGMRIASDERMLPSSMKGYAPVVRGVANTNARVVVKQNNHIIYELSVPAGAFAIDDLYPSGSGDLTVDIIESNGQIHSFIVPYSGGIDLVRKGQVRYQFSVGKYRVDSRTLGDMIYQGEVRYGVLNGLTLNLGSTGTKNYLSNVVGVSFDTPVGYLLTKYAFKKVKINKENKKFSNKELTLSYGLHLPKLDTYILISGFQSFSPNTYSLSDVVYLNNTDLQRYFYNDRLHKQYSFYINHRLGDNLGSFYFSAQRNLYWDNDKSTEYYLSYGNNFKQLQYEIGYKQSTNRESGLKDKAWYVNLSMPLGDSISAPRISSYYTHDRDHNLRTSLYGYMGDNDQINYGLSFDRYASQSSYSSYLGYKNPMVSLDFSATRANNSTQYSSRASGAIVAHPHGVTFGNDISDTFAIVSAKGASGVKINYSDNNRLDWWGNGIVPYLSPYQVNDVSLDPSSLPNNIILSSTGKKIIPRANSAVLVNFDVESSNYSIFDIVLLDGSTPPLAAEAFDEKGNLIGYVMQGGRLFTQLKSDSGVVNIRWGNSQNQQCAFQYDLDNVSSMDSEYKLYSEVCKVGE